jgi:membrane protease YdiL (CAAX protease family)
MKKVYKRSIYTKKDAGNIFLFALLFPPLVLATFMFIVLPLAFLFTQSTSENFIDVTIPIFSLLSAQLGMFLVYLIYNKLNAFDYKKASKLSFKLHWQNILIAVAIGFVVLFGFNQLIGVIDELLVKIVKITPSDLPLPLNNIGWLIANIFLLAAAPAISEELVFRGVIFNGLRQYGKKTAVIVSALLFALIHSSIEQTVYPILFGLILAYIVLKTNNVIYAMIAHFINNAIVIVLNYLVNINSISFPVTPSKLNVEGILTALTYAALAFTVVYILAKFFKKDKDATEPFIMQDLANEMLEEDFEQELEQNLAQNNPETLQGVDIKVWERIYCQKNDLFAIQKTQHSANTLLWVGLGISIFLWFVAL